MIANQNETLTFNCTDCGIGQPLLISSIKRGFLDTGWRADYSRAAQPAYLCADCGTDWNDGRQLREQKAYLAHIFEAQRRFGE